MGRLINKTVLFLLYIEFHVNCAGINEGVFQACSPTLFVQSKKQNVQPKTQNCSFRD